MNLEERNRQLSNILGNKIAEEIIKHSVYKEVPAQTEILREGQYVKVIPLVLRG